MQLLVLFLFVSLISFGLFNSCNRILNKLLLKSVKKELTLFNFYLIFVLISYLIFVLTSYLIRIFSSFFIFVLTLSLNTFSFFLAFLGLGAKSTIDSLCKRPFLAFSSFLTNIYKYKNPLYLRFATSCLIVKKLLKMFVYIIFLFCLKDLKYTIILILTIKSLFFNLMCF